MEDDLHCPLMPGLPRAQSQSLFEMILLDPRAITCILYNHNFNLILGNKVLSYTHTVRLNSSWIGLINQAANNIRISVDSNSTCYILIFCVIA